jgi:hypothetical protein
MGQATFPVASVIKKGEWYEEEGEYEYASYQHGAKEGHEEAHVEPAILVQPLGETVGEAGGVLGDSETAMRLHDLLRQCQADSHRTPRTESCAQYVSLLGDALGVIKKGWQALKSAAHATWRFVGEQTVSWSEFEARVKRVFGIGKEIFGLAKCTYEFFYAKGPCGNP